MKTFRVILNGGIGNQLFQYAFGRALAVKNNARLVLDTSLFKSDLAYSRKYSLSPYQLADDILVEESSTRAHINWNIFKFAHRGLIPKSLLSLLGVFESDRRDALELATVAIPHDIPVVGYWQNHAHFSELRSTLLADLTPKLTLSPVNLHILNEIKLISNSVAVHVRAQRNHKIKTNVQAEPNDFDPSNAHSCLLPLEYYRSALSNISQLESNPIVFVFSDNPDWAATYLAPLNHNFIFLQPQRGEDWEDVYLMSHCKHHVTANSSFSWWGAWLACQDGGVKIAPLNALYTPLIPTHWSVYCD